METLYLIEGSAVGKPDVLAIGSRHEGCEIRRGMDCAWSVGRAGILTTGAHKKMEGAAVAGAPSIQSVGLQTD